MKKFFQYFKDFHKDYFSIWMYGICLLFIAAIIILNYTFPGGNFEDNYVDAKYTRTNLRPIFFFLTHGFAYFGCIGIICFFVEKKK